MDFSCGAYEPEMTNIRNAGTGGSNVHGSSQINSVPDDIQSDTWTISSFADTLCMSGEEDDSDLTIVTPLSSISNYNLLDNSTLSDISSLSSCSDSNPFEFEEYVTFNFQSGNSAVQIDLKEVSVCIIDAIIREVLSH